MAKIRQIVNYYTADGTPLGTTWTGAQMRLQSLANQRQEAGYPKSQEDGNSTTIGYIVGQDNLTGQTLASDGNGSVLKGQLDEQPKALQQVVVSRNKSSQGSRQVSMSGSRKVSFQVETPRLTQGNVGQAEIDQCKSAGSGGGGSPQPPQPPQPPEPPEDPPEPDEPPPAPPGGPNQPEPNPEEDESQPPGEGCTPESDCQWYNTNEAGATEGSGCPAGTTSRGFAQLAENVYKVLCCGPDRPTGDGCPEDPTTYGYQCVNGTCELVPNGLFASASECEQGCNQDEDPEPAMRYTCAGIQCIEAADGEYASLAECQGGCQDGTETWNPPPSGVGPCTPVLGLDGQYTTQGECYEASGQCAERNYFLSANITWEEFDISTGETWPRSFTGEPTFVNPSFATPCSGPIGSPSLTYSANPFFPFQENYSFDITVGMGSCTYRWNRGAGNMYRAVRNVSYSITPTVANPEASCN